MKPNLITPSLLLMLFLFGCGSNDETHVTRDMELRPLDTLVLDKSGLASTFWGPRMIKRGENRRLSLLDDVATYREYDVDNGDVVDEIDFAPFLMEVGLDGNSTLSGVSWLSETECVAICLYPVPSYVLINLIERYVKRIDFTSKQGRPALNAFSSGCSLEPVLLSDGSLLTAVQVHVSNLAGSQEARRSKYTAPPLVKHSFDTALESIIEVPIGSYPEYYLESFVRQMGHAFDVYGERLLLTFDTSRELYQYDVMTGTIVDTLKPPSPVDISSVPYDTARLDPEYFREYYYETSRGPFVRYLNESTFARVYVVGTPLPAGGIVPRGTNEMDWMVAIHTTDDETLSVAAVDGQQFYSNFFEVHDGSFYLMSAGPENDEIRIVRMTHD